MPATSPPPCSNAAMSQRGASEVLLLNPGSYPGFSNTLNQSWKWDGTTWARAGSGVIDASGPLPTRADFASTYDGYNVVVFGGRGQSATDGVLSDTWTWNGTAWTKEAPVTVPFGRFKSEMAYLNVSGAGKAILFGGSNVLNFLNETWVWNGSAKTWTLATSTNNPSVRTDFTFAGGPTFCVLFGGKGTNSCLNHTWKFDGTQWTQLTPTTPPPVRAEASLCYDTANTQWVLFGGRNDFNCLGDTWTLNSTGTAWTQKSPTTSPSYRAGAQMCYDAQAGKVILFGGKNTADTLSDTWSWDGTNWVKL